jgi:predicted RNA-binding Zn-ribbon protein involved in translation (DUF1610 family)
MDTTSRAIEITQTRNDGTMTTQLDLFTAVTQAPKLILIEGGRADGKAEAVSKNDCHCESCNKVLKKRPIDGFETAWTELDELVCDVRTRRLRTAYLCQDCGWHLWEIAA